MEPQIGSVPALDLELSILRLDWSGSNLAWLLELQFTNLIRQGGGETYHVHNAELKETTPGTNKLYSTTPTTTPVSILTTLLLFFLTIMTANITRSPTFYV